MTPPPASHAAQATADSLGLPFLDLSGAEVDPALFALVPADLAMGLPALPLSDDGATLRVAVADPLDLRLEARLASISGRSLQLCVAGAEDIRAAIRRAEGARRVLDGATAAFKPTLVRQDEAGAETVVDLDALQDQSGMVRVANSVLLGAMQRGASDVHIEVYADRVDLKYRIDGVLYPATDPIDARHHSELIGRIKVMAELDVAEHRVPQDGRFRLRIEGRDVDFRVSVLPAQFGEDVVIRVLDKSGLGASGGALSLESLGLGAEDVAAIRRMAREPHGLVLVTGPTGSGKTTTLYGAISELATGEEKIITIEDPIEYQLDGIVQIAVNARKGMTFASGLRAILRHDPDRIMVGEIRDLETAQIAVQAALTGHLVLASVHANSAFDVVSRFAHWGIGLNDLVSSLNGVFAQRLLRRLCPVCARDGEAVGCDACFRTGYSGRIAAVEFLRASPRVAEMLIERAPAQRLRAVAEEEGMVGLRARALALARAGVTTRAEVDRVTFTD
jgi:type IV pilus assembly protein PilB